MNLDFTAEMYARKNRIKTLAQIIKTTTAEKYGITVRIKHSSQTTSSSIGGLCIATIFHQHISTPI